MKLSWHDYQLSMSLEFKCYETMEWNSPLKVSFIQISFHFTWHDSLGNNDMKLFTETVLLVWSPPYLAQRPGVGPDHASWSGTPSPCLAGGPHRTVPIRGSGGRAQEKRFALAATIPNIVQPRGWHCQRRDAPPAAPLPMAVPLHRFSPLTPTPWRTPPPLKLMADGR
jgi:hypothetical protein